MKITKPQLKQIINEELNEILGFGKKADPEHDRVYRLMRDETSKLMRLQDEIRVNSPSTAEALQSVVEAMGEVFQYLETSHLK